MPATTATTAPPPAPRARPPYTDAQKERLFRRILALRHGPFDAAAGETKRTWAEIAAACKVARSTLNEWKGGDAFRAVERRYRATLTEEARTDAAGMGQAALAHVYALMTNPRSEFVQLEAAREILKIANLAGEREEARAEQQGELVAFQLQMLETADRRQRLIAAGIDPAAIVAAGVRPGGRLPELVARQNDLLAADRAERDARAAALELAGGTAPDDDEGDEPPDGAL